MKAESDKNGYARRQKIKDGSAIRSVFGYCILCVHELFTSMHTGPVTTLCRNASCMGGISCARLGSRRVEAYLCARAGQLGRHGSDPRGLARHSVVNGHDRRIQ